MSDFWVSHSFKYEGNITNNNNNIDNNKLTIMGRQLTMLSSFGAVSIPPSKFVKNYNGKGLSIKRMNAFKKRHVGRYSVY
jgi:hypothetical protein